MKKETNNDTTLKNLRADIPTGRIVLFFIFAAAIWWVAAVASPLYILDETRNAQAAREMMKRHDSIVPTFNNELRPDKPPLHYYFMQGAYRIFGVNAWAARFFSVVMGLLTLLSTWFFAKRFINKTVAFWAVVLLTSSTHFLFEFQLSVPDPYLIFFTTAGLFTIYAYIKENHFYWLVLAGISFGLAILAKGPVALAVPGLAVLSWLVFEKNWRKIFSWKWIIFFAIIAAVTLPWFIAVHHETNGDFTRKFFLEHNINRFSKPIEGHGGFFLLIPLYVISGLLPFSGLSVAFSKKIQAPDPVSFLQFCISVTLVFIVFFSISGTKLPNYPMPCYPFIALLMAFWIQQRINGGNKLKSYPYWILIVLNILFLAGSLFALLYEPATKRFAAWSCVFIIPLAASCLALYYHKIKGFGKSLFILVIGYMFFNATILIVAYPSIYKNNPEIKTRHLVKDHEPVFAYKSYNPAFNFYLEKNLIILDSEEKVRKLLQSHSNFRIITREELLPELKHLPLKTLAKERDLFEIPVTVILGPSGFDPQ